MSVCGLDGQHVAWEGLLQLQETASSGTTVVTFVYKLINGGIQANITWKRPSDRCKQRMAASSAEYPFQLALQILGPRVPRAMVQCP